MSVIARVTVEVYQSGVDELIANPTLGQFVSDTADRVAEAIRGDAPVHTGDYAGSISSHPATLGPNGWSAMVTTSDFAWHLIEFGSANNPPYRPFARGVTAAGLNYIDEG